MSRDRSLEDFLGGDDADGERSADPAEGATEETSDAGPEGTAGERTDADPGNTDGESDPNSEDATDGDDDPNLGGATPTHGWSPDGAVCDRCGTEVGQRWADDGAMVCADCKEW